MNDKSEFRELEKRVGNLERTIKRNNGVVQRVVKSVGGLSGAALGYGLVGPYAKDFAEFVGESWHGIDLAIKLSNNYFGNENSVKKYLENIDPGVKERYLENRGHEQLLLTASQEALEAMQRASLKIPTTESKPVKSLRGLKGWIIEKTKGIGKSEEEKEEIHIQNTEEYQSNYNTLARLRMSAVEKRELLNGEIVGQSRKLEKNEYNTEKIDERGLRIFDSLIKEYNNVSDVLRNIVELDIRQINDGVLNKKYEQVVSDAKNYGIIPYSVEGFGDIGLMGATILGAWLGYKVSRPIAQIGNAVYYFGKDIIKSASKVGKSIARKVKRKRLNSSGEKD